MAHIDTYYRINAKAPLSDALLERIARVRELSRAAKTHKEKKKLALKLGVRSKTQGAVNQTQANVSSTLRPCLDE
ncbi:MAG: hypothetical protein ABF370_16630 [Verrucomicrobiales bacterium]|nr:hypothetical protein [Verrucomicrobiaceae bacterium]